MSSKSSPSHFFMFGGYRWRIDRYGWKATLPKLKDWQKDVYFFARANKEEIARRLFLESFFEKEGDILYRTDPIDVHMFLQISDLSGKKFAFIGSENAKINDQDADLVKMYAVKLLEWSTRNPLIAMQLAGRSPTLYRLLYRADQHNWGISTRTTIREFFVQEPLKSTTCRDVNRNVAFTFSSIK
ncbi:Hsp90 protein [Fragilaria crotonensis]|nr:Hsp90 protein [Fragilaria crotonensis]